MISFTTILGALCFYVIFASAESLITDEDDDPGDGPVSTSCPQLLPPYLPRYPPLPPSPSASVSPSAASAAAADTSARALEDASAAALLRIMESGQWPTDALRHHVVHLRYFDAPSCMATLIAPSVLLTAAFCAVEELTRLRARFYHPVHRTYTIERSVVAQVVHPDYNASALDQAADVMVYVLRDPAPPSAAVVTLNANASVPFVGTGDIDPAQSSTTEPGAPPPPPTSRAENTETEERRSTGAVARLAGFGFTSTTQNEPDAMLRIADVPLRSAAACGRLSRPGPFRPAAQLCAGFECAACGACDLDFGAPLLQFGAARGDAVQVGIATRRVACGRRGEADVFTRVSTYAQWIKQAAKTASTTKWKEGEDVVLGTDATQILFDGANVHDCPVAPSPSPTPTPTPTMPRATSSI